MIILICYRSNGSVSGSVRGSGIVSGSGSVSGSGRIDWMSVWINKRMFG
jgi:hypothetical protein